MSILGKRLREARERARLTQIEAAKKLGISNGTLSGYERNYRDPDTETLNKMADFYQVNSDWLLGRSSDPDLSEKEEIILDEKVKELIEIIENMPEEEQDAMKERILTYAKGYADARRGI